MQEFMAMFSKKLGSNLEADLTFHEFRAHAKRTIRT
jgi:hypothetical protein